MVGSPKIGTRVWKGDPFWNSSFWGSMLVFGSALSFWRKNTWKIEYISPKSSMYGMLKPRLPNKSRFIIDLSYMAAIWPFEPASNLDRETKWEESPTPKLPSEPSRSWPVIKSRKVLGANGKAVYMGIMIKSYNRTNTSTWRHVSTKKRWNATMVNRVFMEENGPSCDSSCGAWVKVACYWRWEL